MAVAFFAALAFVTPLLIVPITPGRLVGAVFFSAAAPLAVLFFFITVPVLLSLDSLMPLTLR